MSDIDPHNLGKPVYDEDQVLTLRDLLQFADNLREEEESLMSLAVELEDMGDTQLAQIVQEAHLTGLVRMVFQDLASWIKDGKPNNWKPARHGGQQSA